MFYYLEGTVTVIEKNLAVIDAGGVGFLCNTTTTTLSRLEVGARARLYTYVNVAETALDIYGFYDTQERRCFELLLSVSGVGPKAALSIMSSVTPEGLALAVATDNEKMLTAAPGVGKRTAQRIILELKDKIVRQDMKISAASAAAPAAPGPSGKKLSDVTAALAVLGYSPAEITLALSGMDLERSTEEIIRDVLKGSLK